MVLETWDLSAYAVQTAQFQILDQSTSATWGHIMVDHPLLTD